MKTHRLIRRLRNLFHVFVLAAVLLISTDAARAMEITGVQPYALDHPRVPAYLTPPGAADKPLGAYSEIYGRKISSFECFLDTAASRILLDKRQQKYLRVKTTGKTVKDIGIGGTETFDVSKPYDLYFGDTQTPSGDLGQYPFSMRVVMEVKQKEYRMADVLPKSILDQLGGNLLGSGSMAGLNESLIPPLNVIGTPVLVDHIAILDPRPLADAYKMLSGLIGGEPGGSANSLNQLLSMLESVGSGGGQFGRIGVDLTAADSAYPNPPVVVPLHLKNMESGRVPVTNAPVPVFRGATLVNGSSRVKLDMVLDTGGAVSLISRRVGRKLGLDLGSPELKTMVMGVGKGNAQLNGYWLDGLTIRTSSGGPIFYRRVPFFIADIEGVQGTVGANLLVPSVYINMEKMLDSTGQEANPLAGVMQIFSDMKPGPTPFQKIIIDLPHSRLGLVPSEN